MLVGKEAAGGEHRQLTLSALHSKCPDGKPGQGACCSSFSVGPPYANLASACWPGQLAMAAQATAGGRREGSPQPRPSWSHLNTWRVGGLAPSTPQSLAMTTAVHVDFKGQAPGAGPPCVPGQPGLGVQHSAEV